MPDARYLMGSSIPCENFARISAKQRQSSSNYETRQQLACAKLRNTQIPHAQ